MTLRYHWLCRLGMLGGVGLVAVGCATMDPPALTALNQANDAIVASKKAGAAERFPAEFAALETRYLEARGIFYACRESQAADLARALMADAKGLGAKRAMAPKAAPMPPPPPPANRPPVARLSAPGTGDVNHLLRFQGDASSDPDGDTLSYMWDFGDGMSARFSFPTSTHRYARVGNYNVRLTVDDGRGGTDSTSTLVQISRRLIIISDVLFDTNKAILKPGASEILARIEDAQQDIDPQVREVAENLLAKGQAINKLAEIVGGVQILGLEVMQMIRDLVMNMGHFRASRRLGL